jgi:hypothetical protein
MRAVTAGGKPGENLKSVGRAFVKAAPVLMRVKPAALIRVPRQNGAVSAAEKEPRARIRAEHIVLRERHDHRLVMLFDRERLAGTLGSPGTASFLADLGYPEPLSPDSAIETLKNRIKGESFPHEIGVLLGYPLKDVRGFVERLPPAELPRKTPWRVFGDPAEPVKYAS